MRKPYVELSRAWRVRRTFDVVLGTETLELARYIVQLELKLESLGNTDHLREDR